MIESRRGAMSTASTYAPVGTETMAVGGAPLPRLGFGTYGMSGPRLQEVLVAALRQGFRLIEQLERIADKASIFDFELSQEDMQAIAMLRSPGGRIVHPSHLAPAWD